MSLYVCARGKREIIVRIKQEEARNTEDYCEAVLAGVIDSIQRHFMSLKEAIGVQGKATAARVQTSLQTLEVKMNETRRRGAELERLAQTDDDVHFLEVL